MRYLNFPSFDGRVEALQTQSMIPKKKEAFDKIRSNHVRKQILTDFAAVKGEILCKGDGEALFNFRVSGLSEQLNIEGQIVGLSDGSALKAGDAVIGNFSLNDDKYFMNSSFLQVGQSAVMAFPEQIYLLQRRATNRVDLPEDMVRSVNLIQINGKATFLDAICEDISVGGARLQFKVSTVTLKSGDQLTMVFRIKDKWTFEVKGVIKHLVLKDGAQVFGVEFDQTNKSIANKLQSMTLELQRWAVLQSD